MTRQPQWDFPVDHNFSLLLVQASDSDAAVLCNMSYSVATAPDPAAVLTQLQAGRIPDMIMADWQGSAKELLRTLKSSEQWCNIPVIVTSAEAGPEAVVAAIRAGAADFVVKPLRRNELSTLWRHAWRRRAVLGPPLGLQPPPPHTLLPPPAAAAAAKALLTTNSGLGSGGSGSVSAGSHSSAHSSGDWFRPLARPNPTAPAPRPQHSGATVTSPPHPMSQLQQQLLADPSSLNPTIPVPEADMAAESPFCRAASPPLASAPAPCRSAPAGIFGCTVMAADDDATTMEVDSAAAARSQHTPQQQQQQQQPQQQRQHQPQQQQQRHSFDVATGLSAGGRPAVTAQAAAAAAALLPQALSCLRSSLCAPAPRSLSGTLAVDLPIRPLDVTPPPGSPPCSASAAPQLAPAGALSTPSRVLSIGASGGLGRSCSSAFTTFSSVSKPSAAAAPPAPAMAPHQQQQQQQHTARPAQTARPQPAAPGKVLPAAPTPGTQAQMDHRAVCAANRRAAIAKFRQKREQRNFDKKVRYVSRKRLAESRPRVRGQFVKAEVAAACRALAAVQKDGMLVATGRVIAAR